MACRQEIRLYRAIHLDNRRNITKNLTDSEIYCQNVAKKFELDLTDHKYTKVYLATTRKLGVYAK